MIPPLQGSTLFPYTTLFRSVSRSVRWRLATWPAPCSVPTMESAAPLSVPERSEEHTSELQSLRHLVCRLLLEKKNKDYLVINIYETALRSHTVLVHMQSIGP